MPDELKVGIVGGAGRMGQMNIRQVTATEGCVVAGATEGPGHPSVGEDAGTLAGVGALGVIIGDDPAAMIAEVDVVIDFTVPEATVEHARLAAQAGAALIAGTTGLSPEDEEAVEKAAHHVPVVRAANMSVGITLLSALTEQVAAALGADYDIEVLEMHHRHKVDAPSGTALALGLDVKQAVRDGYTGARTPGDIGFATLRGGDVAGDHDVIFAAEGERLILGHKASSRQVFAVGAIRAALWTKGQAPGLYNMRHVLGFE